MPASNRQGQRVPWLALCVAGACATCTPAVVVLDDGGLVDSSDGAHDAQGADARRDTGAADGAFDAGDPFAGWVDWEERVSPGCPLWLADETVLASTTFAFEPCADRENCRRLVRPWTAPARRVEYGVAAASGWHDGERGALLIFHDLSATVTEFWVVSDRGEALLGLRTARPDEAGCLVGAPDLGFNRWAIAMSTFTDPDHGQSRVIAGDLSRPTELLDLGEVTRLLPGGTTTVQGLQVGADRVASWLMPGPLVASSDWSGRHEMVGDLSLGEGGTQPIEVVGDRLLFLSARWGNRYRLWMDAPYEPPAELVSGDGDFAGLASDGVDLVWLNYLEPNGDRTEFARAELYASPYANEPAALLPRRVTRVSSAFPTDRVRVGNGLVAILEDQRTIGVYRLEDGARAAIVAPAGEEWWGFVHYVGPGEIAVTSGVLRTPIDHRRTMFIRLDSLEFVIP